MDLKSLYKPKFYFKDPQVEAHLKRRGFIKKKAEGLRDQFGLSKASDNVYYLYQLKGKLLAFYTESPKKEGKLIGVVVISLVKEIVANSKDKPAHIELKIDDNTTVSLKIEDKKERDEWLKTFHFFKNYYKDDNSVGVEGYLINLDPDLQLALQAEVELRYWDSLGSKKDYSSFLKDKGLNILFENNMLEIVKNRLAMAIVNEEIKDKKGSVVYDMGVDTKPNQRNSTLSQKRGSKMEPPSDSIHMVLISQRPVNIIDEEFNLEDDAIVEKDSLPPWMNFNKIYYFMHNGPGDVTPGFREFDVL